MPTRAAWTPFGLILITHLIPLSIAAYAVASLFGRQVWILDDVTDGAAGTAMMLACAGSLVTAVLWPNVDEFHKIAIVVGAASWTGRALAYVLLGIEEARWTVIPAVTVHGVVLLAQVGWHLGMAQRAAVDHADAR